MKNNKLLITLIIVTILASGIYLLRDNIRRLVFSPRNSNIQTGIESKDLQSPQKSASTKVIENVKTIATDLDIPWEIAFLPNGDMLVTERPGTLLRIGEDREVISEIEGVEHAGEGGLLGVLLHPEYEDNNYIYLYLTSRDEEGLINRVERYKLEENQLTDKQIIIDQIPGASYHDGGRMEFGPNGYLWITTGDAGETQLAQETNSLAGKILRLNPDGSIPEDNPFNNPVYSYGHRNPQGLAWDDENRLWATEHGPSGAQSGFDELNLIKKGQNYGWPEIRGAEEREGMISPVIQSGANDTWAPAGAAYYKGSIFFAGLRGSSLYEAKIEGEEVTELIAHFKNEFGRLRALRVSQDENIYVTTSNTDGRGDVQEGDDKIIRIIPEIFNR